MKRKKIKSWVNPKYKKESFSANMFCTNTDFKEYVLVDIHGNELDKHKAEFNNTYFYNFQFLTAKYEFIAYSGPDCSMDILYNLS